MENINENQQFIEKYFKRMRINIFKFYVKFNAIQLHTFTHYLFKSMKFQNKTRVAPNIHFTDI